MLSVNEIKRQVVRGLVFASQSGNTRYLDAWGVSEHAASTLANLAPHEIELLMANAADRIALNLDAVVSCVRRNRRDALTRELVQAGCCNRLLRRRFGLGPKELSGLRRELGVRSPGRPRHLTESERHRLHRWLKRHPCASEEHERLDWCLHAWRRHRIPFMAIHRFVSHDISD